MLIETERTGYDMFAEVFQDMTRTANTSQERLIQLERLNIACGKEVNWRSTCKKNQDAAKRSSSADPPRPQWEEQSVLEQPDVLPTFIMVVVLEVNALLNTTPSCPALPWASLFRTSSPADNL